MFSSENMFSSIKLNLLSLKLHETMLLLRCIAVRRRGLYTCFVRQDVVLNVCRVYVTFFGCFIFAMFWGTEVFPCLFRTIVPVAYIYFWRKSLIVYITLVRDTHPLQHRALSHDIFQAGEFRSEWLEGNYRLMRIYIYTSVQILPGTSFPFSFCV